MKNKIVIEIISRISDLIRNFDSTNSEEYYQEIFQLLKKIFDFKYSTIFLLDDEKQQIELVSKHGGAIDLIELIQFEFGQGFSAWVAKEKKPVVLNNLNPSPHKIEPVRSFMSLPLLIEKQLIGVINFGHDENNAFNEDIVEDMHIITSLLAGLFNRNKCYSIMKEQKKEIKLMNGEIYKSQQRITDLEKKMETAILAARTNDKLDTPLQAITGNLQLMENDLVENRKEKRRIKNIQTQVKTLNKILKKIRKLQEPLLKEQLKTDSENS